MNLKEKGKKKTVVLSVRLTKDQHKTIISAYKRSSSKSKGEYFYKCVLENIRGEW